MLATIQQKQADLQRELLGLKHTSKESVCATDWEYFPSLPISPIFYNIIRKYIKTIPRRVTLDWNKEAASFELSQRMLLADKNDELTYVEGFRRIRENVAYLGWCLLLGRVVDTTCLATWQSQSKERAQTRTPIGCFPDWVEYVGRRIPIDLVMQRFETTKRYLPVLLMYDTYYGEPISGRAVSKPI